MANEKEALSTRERLELVLLGLAKEEAVTTICEEAGISRPLFYRWIKQVRRALSEALEAKKRGRKAKSILESPRQAEALQKRVLELEREVAALRKERDRYKLVTEVAQRVIRRKVYGQRGPGTGRRGRPKKSAAPIPPPASVISGAGATTAPLASVPATMPRPGASTESPTGAGSIAGSKAPETGGPGSPKS